MMIRNLLFIVVIFPFQLFAQVQITVGETGNASEYSNYLFGRNNSLSDNPGSPLAESQWQRLRDAGVTIVREGGGNNSTKYNWRRKLGSHPDWYNNVYDHDWDFAATSLQENLPGVQGLWSFQLIGKAAKTSSANFNDWGYNQSQWWTGVAQNLAGGGTVNPAGGADALQDGDPDLYLEDWTADSTTLILDHWFGTNGLGLDKNQLIYWSMDNEIEIWNGTHDDVMPQQLTPDEFMDKYFAVAKKARELYPEIKLLGPVPANEWQWYNWATGVINSGGQYYPWLEYFIKRVAEEQDASGIRLLDVLDIHFYPGETSASDIVQLHRVYFDENYNYPGANGVKAINGGWDNSQTREYIFERCKDWLNEYLGEGHGVTLSVTETGIADVSPDVVNVWYASTLGEFMRHPEMEIFTPWTWQTGMWETIHLFARYRKANYLDGISSNENLVSAYPTINAAKDSITVFLVNRSESQSQTVNISFNDFTLDQESFNVLALSDLPSNETFISHQDNAIETSTVSKSGNTVSIPLAPMSVTAILLTGQQGEITGFTGKKSEDEKFLVYPNPVGNSDILYVKWKNTGEAELDLLDINGRMMRNLFEGGTNAEQFISINMSNIPSGTYLIRLQNHDINLFRKLVIR